MSIRVWTLPSSRSVDATVAPCSVCSPVARLLINIVFTSNASLTSLDREARRPPDVFEPQASEPSGNQPRDGRSQGHVHLGLRQKDASNSPGIALCRICQPDASRFGAVDSRRVKVPRQPMDLSSFPPVMTKTMIRLW